ncbi:uncharacterized protein RJT20DRAFT_135140 [Scheffersomyces xylosifermentans]|uniref:uncharacterized protein n=1 Tax=Scheffersomyces xylosifermentans TaxID=1304137 RepID=UPI00315C7C2F
MSSRFNIKRKKRAVLFMIHGGLPEESLESILRNGPQGGFASKIRRELTVLRFRIGYTSSDIDTYLCGDPQITISDLRDFNRRKPLKNLHSEIHVTDSDLVPLYYPIYRYLARVPVTLYLNSSRTAIPKVNNIKTVIIYNERKYNEKNLPSNKRRMRFDYLNVNDLSKYRELFPNLTALDVEKVFFNASDLKSLPIHLKKWMAKECALQLSKIVSIPIFKYHALAGLILKVGCLARQLSFVQPHQGSNPSSNYDFGFPYMIGSNFVFPCGLRELKMEGRGNFCRLMTSVHLPPNLWNLDLVDIETEDFANTELPNSLRNIYFNRKLDMVMIDLDESYKRSQEKQSQLMT